MRTKNLVILADFNLFYGTTAGVYRMNHYAKAIALGGTVNVYLISSVNFQEHEEMIQCGEGFYTSTEKNIEAIPSGFSQIRQNYLFAKSVNRWTKKLREETVFLIYPSIDFSFEFFLCFYLKLISSRRVYCEVNEVYKSINNENRKSVTSANEFIFTDELRWGFNYLRCKTGEFFSSNYDGLVCITSNIEFYYKRYNKNTVVVPILSDFDGQAFNYDDQKKDFKILFTGYIGVRKENLIEFLSALGDLNLVYPNWTFDMCGPIPFGDEKIIHEILESYKIESKVNLLGVLPHNEVVKMQQNATLLVLPRSNDKQNFYGFSTKLSEYAVSGTPILMTDTGVVSSFFKDNFNCFMVDGYKRRNFYDKLLTVISTDESERRRIAQNAYDTALENFEYCKYSNVFTSFFKLDK